MRAQLERKNENRYVIGTLIYLSYIVLQNKYINFNISVYIDFKIISAHACTLYVCFPMYI